MSGLSFALVISYRSLGVSLAATFLYTLAMFGQYWPTESLSIGYFLFGCLLSAAACLLLEFEFRSWGIRGKFALAGLVQLVACVCVIPAISRSFSYLVVCIAIYFLGVYGFHDGMRMVRTRLGLKTDLNSRVPVSESRYDPRRDHPWIHVLVGFEALIYSIGSYIFAKKLASLLNNYSMTRIGLSNNQLANGPLEPLKEGVVSAKDILASICDFVGFLTATLAFVALAYFLTGREAMFSGGERAIYIALLSISGCFYLLSRIGTNNHRFTYLMNGLVPITLIIFWGFLARDRLQSDVATWRSLEYSPSVNWMLDQKTSTLVQRTVTLIEHFPCERLRINQLLNDYVEEDFEEIVSNDEDSHEEQYARLSDLRQAVVSGQDYIDTRLAKEVLEEYGRFQSWLTRSKGE